MVIAALVNQYAPSHRGFRRRFSVSGDSSSRLGTSWQEELDEVNEIAVDGIADNKSGVRSRTSFRHLTSDSIQPSLTQRKKHFRANALLTSAASDFDTLSDWGFYYVMLQREKEIELNGQTPAPQILKNLVLLSCLVGTFCWLILATDGRVLTPLLKALNIDGLSLGYVLVFCVIVEDIPQMILTFMIEEYYENDMSITNYAIMNVMTSTYDMLIKLAEAYDERNDVVETGAWCKQTFRGHKGAVSTVVALPPQYDHDCKEQPILFSFSEDDNTVQVNEESACGGILPIDNLFCDDLSHPSIIRNNAHTTLKKVQSVTPCFLSGSHDGVIRLWDPSTPLGRPKCMRKFKAHQDAVTAIAILGQNLVEFESSVESKGDNFQQAHDANYFPKNHAKTKNGKSMYFISGSMDGGIILWDLLLKTPVKIFSTENDNHNSPVTSLASFKQHISYFFVSTHRNGTAQLWSIETGEIIRIFRGHENSKWVTDSCSCGNNMFLTSSEDCTIRLWDATDAQIKFKQSERPRKENNTNYNRRVAFARGRNPTNVNANSSSVVSWFDRGLSVDSSDSLSEKLPQEECKSKRTFLGHTGAVFAITLFPMRKAFLSASADRTARLWSLESGQCLQVFVGHINGVSSVSTFDHGTILTGSFDKTIKLWDACTGICLRTYDDHGDYVTSVTSCSNDWTFLSGSYDQSIKLWVVTSSTVVDSLEDITEENK